MNFDRFFTDEIDSASASVSNAAKNVKVELKRLEKIEKRRKNIDDLFRQIALASRLKVELSVCSTRRSPPIICYVKFRRLSDGKCLILVNLKNVCKENLIGWQLIVHCKSFYGQTKRSPFNISGENSQATNIFCQDIPSLSDGCSVDLDVYCKSSVQLPTFVKCFLAKTFYYKCPKYKEMKTKTFQICLRSELFTILELITTKLEPTFVPKNFRTEPNLIAQVEEMKFCFSLAILKCLRKDQYDENFRKNAEVLLTWLFPNVQNVSGDCENDAKIRLIDLVVDSNHILTITMQVLKINEIQMHLELTGFENFKIAKSVKFFILTKYLRFVNDCLKVAKTVDINLASASFVLEHVEQGEAQENVTNFLNHLTENVLWKLPLV